jgi:hypothetical protein
MEKPRYWFKAVKLPCALEQAVLRVRVFEREDSWQVPLYRNIDSSEAATEKGIEVENGLVIPAEDPLLVVLDRIRNHHDEVAAGNALLRCWATLVRGNGAGTQHISTKVGHEVDQEDPAIDVSSPTGNRVMIFEISDGIQTEIDGFLKGLELVGESVFRAVLVSYSYLLPDIRGGRTAHPNCRCLTVSNASLRKLSRLSTSIQD